eukprot:2312110-Rhodomonas_salina.1
MLLRPSELAAWTRERATSSAYREDSAVRKLLLQAEERERESSRGSTERPDWYSSQYQKRRGYK